MGKIDTSEWKEFRVGELFEACLSKDDIQPKDFVEGKIPLVSSGKENNGIIAFVEDEKARLWEKNTLTIDMFGKVFYQESPYFAVSHGRVNILLPKISMTKGCLQFIGCAIEKVASQKYAFNEMCTGTKVLKNNIKLPSTPDGAPDWAYMESYMANLETKVADSLTMLQAAKDAEKKKVDTREWREFRVGELFDAALSKDDIQPKVIVEGNTPLVSSGKENNGMIALIDNKNARLWEANTLTVDMFGKVFYQEQPYYAVSHGRVNILMPRMPMTKHCMQFIGCAIERVTSDKYAFSEMCTGTKLLKDVILLPKDKTGQPDWAYMEEYMRKVEEKAKNLLNHFEKDRNGV